MMKFFLSILLMVTSLQAIAAIDVYEFESPEQEQRYRCGDGSQKSDF